MSFTNFFTKSKKVEVPLKLATLTTCVKLPLPGSGKCGLYVDSKIFGGNVSGINEFPWSALLEYSWGTFFVLKHLDPRVV